MRAHGDCARILGAATLVLAADAEAEVPVRAALGSGESLGDVDAGQVAVHCLEPEAERASKRLDSEVVELMLKHVHGRRWENLAELGDDCVIASGSDTIACAVSIAIAIVSGNAIASGNKWVLLCGCWWLLCGGWWPCGCWWLLWSCWWLLCGCRWLCGCWWLCNRQGRDTASPRPLACRSALVETCACSDSEFSIQFLLLFPMFLLQLLHTQAHWSIFEHIYAYLCVFMHIWVHLGTFRRIWSQFDTCGVASAHAAQRSPRRSRLAWPRTHRNARNSMHACVGGSGEEGTHRARRDWRWNLLALCVTKHVQESYATERTRAASLQASEWCGLVAASAYDDADERIPVAVAKIPLVATAIPLWLPRSRLWLPRSRGCPLGQWLFESLRHPRRRAYQCS